MSDDTIAKYCSPRAWQWVMDGVVSRQCQVPLRVYSITTGFLHSYEIQFLSLYCSYVITKLYSTPHIIGYLFVWKTIHTLQNICKACLISGITISMHQNGSIFLGGAHWTNMAKHKCYINHITSLHRSNRISSVPFKFVFHKNMTNTRSVYFHIILVRRQAGKILCIGRSARNKQHPNGQIPQNDGNISFEPF